MKIALLPSLFVSLSRFSFYSDSLPVTLSFCLPFPLFLLLSFPSCHPFFISPSLSLSLPPPLPTFHPLSLPPSPSPRQGVLSLLDQRELLVKKSSTSAVSLALHGLLAAQIAVQVSTLLIHCFNWNKHCVTVHWEIIVDFVNGSHVNI